MAIVPFNFANQPVTAADMAAVISAVLTDGRLHGCDFTYSGNTLEIHSGRIVMSGYVFRLSATQSISVPGTSGQKSVVAKIDLSAASTESSFAQVSFRVESGSYTPIQGDLIGSSDQVYEIIAARVNLGSSGITSLAYILPNAHRAIHEGTSAPSAADGQRGDLYVQY